MSTTSSSGASTTRRSPASELERRSPALCDGGHSRRPRRDLHPHRRLHHGFENSPDGWRIKCLPRVEAEIFRQGLGHDTWDRLDQIATPVTVVCMEHSDTHQEPHLTPFVERFNDAELIVVPDVGHFLPLERPDVVASMIQRIFGDPSLR